jgi:CRISPR-associated protein (TIGR02710 family)
MRTYRGLILTVGMTHEPVIFSIQQTAAEKVAFVCTPDSDKTLDSVFQSVPFAPSNWRKYVVPDSPEHIGKLCLDFHAAYRWLTEECGIPHEGIAADPTAGRKWMSSGATMIAAFLGLAMHYVDARFVGGKPDPATMKLVELGNAYDQTGFVEAEKGRVLFNSFEFTTSAQVFAGIRPSLSTQADLYAGLADLARALERWERFDHYKQSLGLDFKISLDQLQRYLNSLSSPNPPLVLFVEKITALADAIEELHKGPRPAIGFTVDLFENARRRIAQGRFDDACSRLYRTLESFSQFFLQKDFEIETARPNYSRLTEEQRASISTALGELPKALDLVKGQRVLKALNHRLADQLIAPNGKLKFAGLLEDRDHSILAHGFEPIAEKRVSEFVARLEQLLKEAVGHEFHGWSVRLKVPELPPLLR